MLQIEINIFSLCHIIEMLPGGDGEARCFNRVFTIVANLSDKFGQPRIFMPAGCGIEQKRRVGFEHPFHTFDDGGNAVPDFGIAGRKLPAIGKRCFHGGIGVFFENADFIPALEQSISGGCAGDTSTNDCDVGHVFFNSVTKVAADMTCLSVDRPHLSRYLRAWPRSPDSCFKRISQTTQLPLRWTLE